MIWSSPQLSSPTHQILTPRFLCGSCRTVLQIHEHAPASVLLDFFDTSWNYLSLKICMNTPFRSLLKCHLCGDRVCTQDHCITQPRHSLSCLYKVFFFFFLIILQGRLHIYVHICLYLFAYLGGKLSVYKPFVVSLRQPLAHWNWAVNMPALSNWTLFKNYCPGCIFWWFKLTSNCTFIV